MQAGNLKMNVGAQYNQKRLFLQHPPLDCKLDILQGGTNWYHEYQTVLGTFICHG
jgi:hypothetical protein